MQKSVCTSFTYHLHVINTPRNVSFNGTKDSTTKWPNKIRREPRVCAREYYFILRLHIFSVTFRYVNFVPRAIFQGELSRVVKMYFISKRKRKRKKENWAKAKISTRNETRLAPFEQSSDSALRPEWNLERSPLMRRVRDRGKSA